MYRHGDVLLRIVNCVPRGARKLPHLTLAHGELTGHSHRVKEQDQAELFESGGDLFLNVKGEFVTLIHQEHNEIEIPQGVYRVWRQREYSPQAIRIVRD